MEKIEIIRAEIEKRYNANVELMKKYPVSITAAPEDKYLLDFIDELISESK